MSTELNCTLEEVEEDDECIREKRPVAYSFQDAPDSEEVLPQSVNSNRYKNAKKHYRGCHPFSIHLTSTWNT
ncbi:hypothetical protein AALO_G00308460 [Alosa alosa]|uniref:Uncharacterized protein n=1 Tax=Alosa alosa TaxID=278164 RepID=A0AAV6FJ84_9TELE|nr:hypothetical protein AALO_G00308460 [Alosa alosa]